MAITSRFDVISAMAEGSGDGALIRNTAIAKSTVAFKKLLPLRLWVWVFPFMFIIFPMSALVLNIWCAISMR